MDYQEFLASKIPQVQFGGFEVNLSQINSKLFPWQAKIVQWALKLGQAALFEECGLGKTAQHLEWAHHVADHTRERSLIVAPLAVAKQTIREGKKFGYDVAYCRDQESANRTGLPVVVTNYEMLKYFDPDQFKALVIDESSILKNYVGKRKREIFAFREKIPYLLAPTATPAPNDHLELGNHAEFLRIMQSSEMIARWFVNDAMEAGNYRLKGHGAEEFWRWVAGWAVCISKPSDMGYSDDGFILPPLHILEHVVSVDHTRAFEQGRLFLDAALSSTSMWKEKKATLEDRCNQVVDLVMSEPTEPYIVWYDTEDEAQYIASRIPDALLVMGKHKLEVKEERLNAFSDGLERVIITHRKIAGLGLNWQHCARMAMFGTYSFESMYQALRRSLRYGQTREVFAHIIAAETEQGIMANLRQKEDAYSEMQRAMSKAMAEVGFGSERGGFYTLSTSGVTEGTNYTLYQGDCVEVLKNLPDNKVKGSACSPPFEGLYIYSSHVQDMGNCSDVQEFGAHYRFMLREQYRVSAPGSLHAVHCKDLPLYRNKDEAMGLRDFPGTLIRLYEEAGFIAVDWLTVWKDPVIEMQRTKNAGLLWTEAFCKRAERARQGMADYVLIFQKPTKGQKAKKIRQHTPLPQSVIERCVDLWCNLGERIIAPGIKDNEEGRAGLIIYDDNPDYIYAPNWIKSTLMDGRNLVCHVCDMRQMPPLIEKMKPHRLVFHSRVALTDGTWLVVFRNWVEEMPDTHVTHNLETPFYMKPVTYKRYVEPDWASVEDGEWKKEEDGRVYEMAIKYQAGEVNPNGHKFVGSDAPTYYDSDRDYSIQVWQRYASPVWYDLEGLPESHPNILMNINQTNVLNGRLAREDQDEKHICPLQLDLIEEMLERISKPGYTILSTFAGIGSEGVVSIKKGRKFIGIELKRSYWEQAKRFLEETEKDLDRVDMLTWAGIKV